MSNRYQCTQSQQIFFIDSVVYISRPGDEYEVPRGDYLGDMTDELSGGHITEFVGCGPKQYAYKALINGKEETCCKIRGFTLNSAAAKVLNYNTLKNKVDAYLDEGEKLVTKLKFFGLRRTQERDIVTKCMSKKYRIVYDKCRVLGSGMTLPFGY